MAKTLYAERRFLTTSNVTVYEVDAYTAVKGSTYVLPMGSIVILDSRCRVSAGGTITIQKEAFIFVVVHSSDQSKNFSLAETAQPVQVTVLVPPTATASKRSKSSK